MGEQTVTESRIATGPVQDYLHAGQAISELTEWFRAFGEATFDALILSEGGTLIHANSRAVELLGYEEAEALVGLDVTALTTPAFMDEVENLTLRHHEGVYLIDLVRKDGTCLPVNMQGRSIDYEGHVVHVASIRDVTEHRRVAQALRWSEAQNRAILDAFPDALVRLSRDGTYLDVRLPHGYKLHDDPDALVGRSVHDIFPPDVAERAMAALKQAFDTGTVQTFEYEVDVDGERRVREARVALCGTDEAISVQRDVTERRQAEAALHESAAQLARAQQIAHLGSWEWDVRTGALTWSDELYRIFGLAPEADAITFEQYLTLLHPADRDRTRDIIQKALHTHEPYSFYHRIVRPDGTERIVRGEGEVVAGSDGEVVKMYGTALDVTEARRAQEALEASRALLDSILTSSLDGIMAFEAVHDPTGRIVDFTWLLANPAGAEMIGQVPEALVGAYLLDEHPAVRECGLFDAFVQVVETGEPLQTELEYDAQEGKEWFAVTAVKLGDGLAVTFQNVTERNASAERLARSQALLSRAQRIARLGSWEWEIQAGTLTWSDELYRIFGLDPDADAITFEQYLSYIHPDDRQRVEEVIQEAMQTHQPYSFHHQVVRADGTIRIIRSDGEMVTDADGQLLKMYGTAHDVTERRHAEGELERINIKLKQRNRELQDFAYVASHDLQEPLRKIRAFADLMKEDYSNAVDETGHFYLDRMQDAATRMSGLISDLLAFSHITTRARPFSRIDLNTIAAEVLSDLEIQISEIEATVDVGELPAIEADPTQMRQLMLNLIGNALKFHRPDERPVVTVRATVERYPASMRGLHKPTCRLVVQDNGIGFDEKYLGRIFTPFQRLHSRSAYAGTGMGLAICRRIVERHQGIITAHSTPGAGSTFIIALPLYQMQDHQETSTT